MAASAEARLWIAKGYRAVQDARSAQEARARAIEQYELVLTKTRQLESLIDDLEARLEDGRKQSEKYSSQATASEKRAEEALKKASGLDRKVFELGGQVKERQAALTKVQTDLTSSRENLSSLRQSFSVLRKQTDEANNQVVDLSDDITELEAKIRSGEGNLQDLQRQLTEKQAALSEAETFYNETRSKLEADLEKVARDLQQTQINLSFAEQYLQQFATDALREPLIFNVGEELVRYPVDRQLNATEAQRALDTVLRQARNVAADRGAREGNEADLIELTVNNQRVTVAQQREAIIRALTGRGQESLLVIRAPMNAFRGQFVALDVQIFNNPVVFQEGELLGEERIEANASASRIIEQVTNLLSGTVRQRAVDRRMIVAEGGEVGRITPAEVFELVRSIQSLQRVVRLQAIAKEETRAGGPLLIDFRLR
jgi:predicted  nucleic acid-binding Zn-ribbon protein